MCHLNSNKTTVTNASTHDSVQYHSAGVVKRTSQAESKVVRL